MFESTQQKPAGGKKFAEDLTPIARYLFQVTIIPWGFPASMLVLAGAAWSSRAGRRAAALQSTSGSG